MFVKSNLLFSFLILCYTSVLALETPFVSVEKFGAVADATFAHGKWMGTDNASAFNRCAAYCRKMGLTMLVPKGNYGVGSTIWLTNPRIDGLKQASLSLIGSNKGAYLDQDTSANICILGKFKHGTLITTKKANGVLKEEPDLIPVLGIRNGRQVHIQGIGIQNVDKNDLFCGVAIGAVSQMISIRNCSITGTYAGIVFPGIRVSKSESVTEGNNDLLVVEQSTFNNHYNIVCAGTQPFACEYRSNRFVATRSIFSGTLLNNHWGHSRGSHKFSSNLFGSTIDGIETPMIYFDLHLNEVTIDSNHFEPSFQKKIPEILVRSFPNGGSLGRTERISFTNNIANLLNVNSNPSKIYPIFDVMTGSPLIIQGNHFRIATALRIKAERALLLGNTFHLGGPHQLNIEQERHSLKCESGKVVSGLYDFNHFFNGKSDVDIQLVSGNPLLRGKHYRLHYDKNAFEITEEGKKELDRRKECEILVSYLANDASRVMFEAWGGGTISPPHGWRSIGLTAFGNKIVSKSDAGKMIEKRISDLLQNSQLQSTVEH